MKELILVHALPLRNGPSSRFREPGSSWERQPDGAYIVRPEGTPSEEFIVPASGIIGERRDRAAPSKSGK